METTWIMDAPNAQRIYGDDGVASPEREVEGNDPGLTRLNLWMEPQEYGQGQR